MDKKSGGIPTEEHPTHQQKRHSIKSALKNGGAADADGLGSLKPLWQIPCLSGKKQGILLILGLFFGFWRCFLIRHIVG